MLLDAEAMLLSAEGLPLHAEVMLSITGVHEKKQPDHKGLIAHIIKTLREVTTLLPWSLPQILQ